MFFVHVKIIVLKTNECMIKFLIHMKSLIGTSTTLGSMTITQKNIFYEKDSHGRKVKQIKTII